MRKIWNFRSYIKPISLYSVKNLQVIPVFPAEQFSLETAADIYGQVHSDFNQEAYTATISELNVYILKKGIFENGLEEIYTSKKEVIQEITAQDVNPQIDQIFPRRKKLRIRGSLAYFNLSTLENVYGHYWCEYISQIYLLFCSKIQPDWYIFTQDLSFQKEFIPIICSTFGISESKILLIPKGTIVQPDTLIFTSLLNSKKIVTCGTGSDWNKVWFPSFVKNVYKMIASTSIKQRSVSEHFSKKLYISRKYASIRKTENEEAVIELVQKYGFKVIYPEKISIKDQIALFISAKYVIGTIGSGLSAFFVTQESNAELLELHPEFFPDTHFKILCSLCGIKYNYIRCKQTTINSKERIIPRKENFTADLNGIELLCKSISD